MPIDVFSISGGKDSTAMYLLGLERGRPFRSVFADVGNEHEDTLDFVSSLAQKTGGPAVEWVSANFDHLFPRRRKTIAEKWPQKGISDEIVQRALSVMHPSGNRFLDLCLLRGGMPSWNQRFCTHRLKIEPIQDQIYKPILWSGQSVVNWQGTRADESTARADLPILQRLELPPLHRGESGYPSHVKMLAHRPLQPWTIEDVWAMHKRHNLTPNPLYNKGFKRVGCMTCIMAGRDDLIAMYLSAPEHYERWREWEFILSHVPKTKGDLPTLIPIVRIVKDYEAERRRGLTLKEHGIEGAVKWAFKGHETDDLIGHDHIYDHALSCEQFGVCE